MNRSMPGALGTLLLTLGLLAAAPARAARERAAPAVEASPKPTVLRATVLHVVDGDTLVVRPMPSTPRPDETQPAPPTAHPLRIRLAGIDAPELCQRGGGEARQALATLVAGQVVHLTLEQVDRYARLVARITLDGQDIAARLVGQGLAWSQPAPGRRKDPYAALEAQAREQHRGVFADADPIRPRDFREQHGACPHAPGSRLKQWQPQPPAQ